MHGSSRACSTNQLETVLRDEAGLPGVTRTTGTTGPWDVAGSTRIVHLSDGTTCRETVKVATAPDYFAYRLTEFSSRMIGRLVQEANGQWWFTDEGSGTQGEVDVHGRGQVCARHANPLSGHQDSLASLHELGDETDQGARGEGSREGCAMTQKQWDFDLVALHGPQEMTAEDRAYRGSRYAEVRKALYANPYRGGASGQEPGPLPMFKSTIRNAWRGLFFGENKFRQASARVMDSRADLRWGADGKGWRRIIAPNGICVLGTWEITADNPYTGYFRKGSKGLTIGRFSSDGNETKRGQRRSISLGMKIYPTMDPEHPTPLIPASVIVQEDLGGMRTDYMNDAELVNAPSVHRLPARDLLPDHAARRNDLSRPRQGRRQPPELRGRRAWQACRRANQRARAHAVQDGARSAADRRPAPRFP